jgi:hypothetical protein
MRMLPLYYNSEPTLLSNPAPYPTPAHLLEQAQQQERRHLEPVDRFQRIRESLEALVTGKEGAQR